MQAPVAGVQAAVAYTDGSVVDPADPLLARAAPAVVLALCRGHVGSRVRPLCVRCGWGSPHRPPGEVAGLWRCAAGALRTLAKLSDCWALAVSAAHHLEPLSGLRRDGGRVCVTGVSMRPLCRCRRAVGGAAPAGHAVR